ncbi:MAG: twin-arginine translocation signal domain-containing protein, partial [candidate division Zixibacteria bacterium]
MNRRQFMKTTAAGLLAATCTPSVLNAQKNKVKPNIVLIMADDISAKDFPTYRTPNPTYGDAPCSTPVLEKVKDNG